MAYFSQMTTQREDENKKNVVLMGRKTWDAIPSKHKPLKDRFNFIMSRAGVNLEGYKDCYSFKSLEDVINKLEDEKFKSQYENVWVIGGSHIYEVSKTFSFDCPNFKLYF